MYELVHAGWILILVLTKVGNAFRVKIKDRACNQVSFSRCRASSF